jgi:4-hydroxy-tetrahydrodipicolinate reductase
MASAAAKVKLKLALIGYGKMGKAVEAAALQRNHDIVKPEFADCLIDFTAPDAVLDNVRKYAPLKRNIIMGTSGWADKYKEIESIVKEEEIGFLHSTNFSLGVNLFFKIVEEAAKLVNHYPQYDVGGLEIHHNEKKDSPSGTAMTLAKKLVQEIHRKKRVQYDKINKTPSPDEIHFASLRMGSVPGTHSVYFDSSADRITLTHEAKGREGFSLGAVVAAEWLQGKKGIYTMEDVFKC